MFTLPIYITRAAKIPLHQKKSTDIHLPKGITNQEITPKKAKNLQSAQKGTWELLSLIERTSDIPPLPMGLQAILILLPPGQDSDMPPKFTQKATQISPESQESFSLFPDRDSSNGSVKPSSSSQSNDVRHPVSAKDGFRHDISVQKKQKPSTSAREGRRRLLPFQQSLIYAPVPKGSTTSFPVIQGNFRHTLVQIEDLRSSLSYQGRDAGFQYEYGAPICDPSILGGHRYSHSVKFNLKRIARQNRCWSSTLSHQGSITTSQCDQKSIKLSYNYPVQDKLRMLNLKNESIIQSASNTLNLRCATCEQREFRNVPTNHDWARTSISTLRSPRHAHSDNGGFRPYKP
ncbi:uncharacterized protein LOC121138221 [Mesocricetus auratus]|uniref:Uncharacterized protein LOC121138221 n=1 Tax=Mesocricetus auratus TaxID=10036 RepID=A0ABM2X1Y7_MESAU|nr:uncharacterized protein LOC121138221 [Mesocricetus auratus]XP_040596921.1 uncharacterized protein LOC121138221 [Mesocricetus auratus]